MSEEKKHKRQKCKICGREQAMVNRYNIKLCRQCFRQLARDLGFEKYR